MSLWTKAAVEGIVIEGLLLGLMLSGIEFGHSCKPDGFGLVLIMLHYPALMWGPHLPQWLTILFAAVFGLIAWSVVIYVILRLIRLGRKALR